MLHMDLLLQTLALFLPDKALDHFDLSEAKIVADEIQITLVEKNMPPASTTPLVFKGYKDIIVSDFPIRGKHASLTFRRRYWKQEGKEEWITNDIPLVFPGTKLEKVFADFLKASGGVESGILGEYSSE